MMMNTMLDHANTGSKIWIPLHAKSSGSGKFCHSIMNWHRITYENVLIDFFFPRWVIVPQREQMPELVMVLVRNWLKERWQWVGTERENKIGVRLLVEILQGQFWNWFNILVNTLGTKINAC